MSASTTIVCDRTWAEGRCVETFRSQAATVEKARVEAFRAGWQEYRGLDYCPEHTVRRP